MKKVVLLGDSIRMGYDKYVKEALEGVAQVYYPSENCRFSQYMLRYIHDWKKKGEWGDDVDLVHWNAGLWDVFDLFDDGPMSSLEHYTQTLVRIDRRIRMLFPNAKVVFALTTTVNEALYAGGISMRRNSVIDKYNRAAIEVLKDTGTIFNDLYSLTKDIPMDCRSDKTHFNNPKGAAVLGGQVVATICRELDIPAKDVNIENFELEKYSKDNIGF